MILTPHFLLGAAIAANIKIPLIAFPLALLSHYLLDFIPHWDYSTYLIKSKKWQNAYRDFLKIIIDFVFSMLIVIFFSKEFITALLGGFFATLPDIVTFFYILFPSNKILILHNKFHDSFLHQTSRKKISLFWKVGSEFAITALAILLLTFQR